MKAKLGWCFYSTLKIVYRIAISGLNSPQDSQIDIIPMSIIDFKQTAKKNRGTHFK